MEPTFGHIKILRSVAAGGKLTYRAGLKRTARMDNDPQAKGASYDVSPTTIERIVEMGLLERSKTSDEVKLSEAGKALVAKWAK